jgi:hypothetical protein
MGWIQIPQHEYHRLHSGRLHVGATFSNPDWSPRFGEPHMLTEWLDEDDEPVLRHQCWPRGQGTEFARPCLLERWVA